ncbi:MAG: DUF1614 domain-containing protein, partial [Moorella sp. (in: Bacteria)]|nr:DUF1614 domain-containing protein [Moorella sp. (in: firmicutes)]
LAFFLASAAGSVINIPVSRERVVVPRRVNLPFFLFYYPPTVEERVICLNVGGALLPAALSLYLLATVSPFLPAVLATAAVALLAKAMAASGERPRRAKEMVARLKKTSRKSRGRIRKNSNSGPKKNIAQRRARHRLINGPLLGHLVTLAPARPALLPFAPYSALASPAY